VGARSDGSLARHRINAALRTAVWWCAASVKPAPGLRSASHSMQKPGLARMPSGSSATRRCIRNAHMPEMGSRSLFRLGSGTAADDLPLAAGPAACPSASPLGLPALRRQCPCGLRRRPATPVATSGGNHLPGGSSHVALHSTSPGGSATAKTSWPRRSLRMPPQDEQPAALDAGACLRSSRAAEHPAPCLARSRPVGSSAPPRPATGRGRCERLGGAYAVRPAAPVHGVSECKCPGSRASSR